MENLPHHVAIIMDGNGRWAKARHLPVLEGHRKGAEALRRIVRYAKEKNISYLTAYSFSTENWRRSKIEIEGLMNLIRFNLEKHLRELVEENIKIRVIGDLSAFPKDVQMLITKAVEKTSRNTQMMLILALNYGSRSEITRAVQALIKESRTSKINPEIITEKTIEEHLYTKDIPDPDLLIRTSGEMRISNFLLWQCAYSEFLFPSTLWPDFGEKEFEEALEVYASRQRRFGARPK